MSSPIFSPHVEITVGTFDRKGTPMTITIGISGTFNYHNLIAEIISQLASKGYFEFQVKTLD